MKIPAKTLHHLADACDKRASRFRLDCVRFQVKGDYWIATATNGRSLLMVRGEGDGHRNEEILVLGKALRQVATGCRDSIPFWIIDGLDLDLPNGVRARLKAEEGKFPDLDPVLSMQENMSRLSLNGKLLNKLAYSVGNEFRGMKMLISEDSMKPIVAMQRKDGVDFFAMLMPVLADDKEYDVCWNPGAPREQPAK